MKFLIVLALLALGLSTQARVHDGVLLILDNPELLQKIEARGYSAAEMIEGASAPIGDNKTWSSKPYYGSIVRRLQQDLADVKQDDPRLGETMRSSYRMFDSKWFSSSESRYELVGVVNRMDRASFYKPGEEGACGEVRFIYRLSYRRENAVAGTVGQAPVARAGTSRAVIGETIYTRLPMTFNVVYWAPGKDCAATAKMWLRAAEPKASDLDAILAGPLEKAQFPIGRQKSVELNLQSVRWPSRIRPDLGGHAEYIMRVFHRGASKFEVATMENTPADDLPRAELLKVLKSAAVVKAFDQGIALLPEKFLATSARSVAFYGQSRQANRPFEKFVSEKDVRDLVYDGGQFVKSPAGYVRRLNEMSCMGCHQGRSIAGFHFVGMDPVGTMTANSIKVSHSAHLVRDLPRRAAFVKAVASGAGADPARPFAERALRGEGGYGDHCGMGGDATFREWTCAAGFECKLESAPVGGSPVGMCLPRLVKGDEMRSGDPCDAGVMSQNFDPHKDRLNNKKQLACGEGRGCFAAGEGFPGGLCFGDCDSLKSGEACGLIAVDGFNECLYEGKLFTHCLRDHTSGIALRGCDEETPCRDDYICTGAPSEKKGACIPPYFLFQLRLDGHVKPL